MHVQTERTGKAGNQFKGRISETAPRKVEMQLGIVKRVLQTA
jgi:hypothetical protein